MAKERGQRTLAAILAADVVGEIGLWLARWRPIEALRAVIPGRMRAYFGRAGCPIRGGISLVELCCH